MQWECVIEELFLVKQEEIEPRIEGVLGNSVLNGKVKEKYEIIMLDELFL